MSQFSIYLPRIDTRSLPAMADYATQPEYEDACAAHIRSVLSDRGLGDARISLLRKYTADQYLFFAGFVHFDAGLSGTPAADRFRASLDAEGQSRISLPGGFYWLVQPYRARSPKNSTLEHQQRLLAPPPLPRPKLVRQNGGVYPHEPPAENTPPNVGQPAPPACFSTWYAAQPPAVQTGYRSALNSGQSNLVSQYHAEAVRHERVRSAPVASAS